MRPYIICHMTASIDGKVTGDFLSSKECEAAVDAYYRINREFRADAYACGRITMEGSFTGGYEPDLTGFAGQKIPREDYIADTSAGFFAVSFDRRGRLGWQSANICDEDPGYDAAHIIEVLCEGVSDEYLAYIRSIGVSYIFAGKEEMDLEAAVTKLREVFGIKKLLLEGGSILNGAFQRAGLIDELSIVVAPISADAEDKPLFYRGSMKNFDLTAAKELKGGAVWMRYKAK